MLANVFVGLLRRYKLLPEPREQRQFRRRRQARHKIGTRHNNLIVPHDAVQPAVWIARDRPVLAPKFTKAIAADDARAGVDSQLEQMAIGAFTAGHLNGQWALQQRGVAPLLVGWQLMARTGVEHGNRPVTALQECRQQAQGHAQAGWQTGPVGQVQAVKHVCWWLVSSH